MTFIDAADRRHDLARCAIAALKSVVIDEGSLHRMQFAAIGETFDRGHAVSLRGDRKRQTRQHATAVDQNRASAALAVIAAFLSASQSEALAQQVEQ